MLATLPQQAEPVVTGGIRVVEGLTIGQREQLRDRVSKKSTTLELLVLRGSVEVTRHRIEKGKHFYLDKAAEWTGFEFIYVLQGELELDSTERRIRLAAGDYLHHEGLSERAFFRVNSDVELLMVSSPPSYHLIQDEIQEMMALARAVEEKDEITEGHCYKLERLAILTGERLRLSGQRLIDLSYGAYLHDVGKVRVPDGILNKESALTPEEQGEMRRHTEYGAAMLAEKEFLTAAARIVEAHHERYDGSGYPHGWKGREIPIEARIIAVVDAYDAITSERPYQSAQGRSLAIAELKKHAGTQFDPKVVEAFIEVIGGDGEG
jgi:putative nucleotidyltransferase with HDIG domain